MRATINLPDALGEAAKQRAAAEGRTFTSLIEEGLRSVLANPTTPTRHVPLPTFGDPTQHPLVDLSDKDALWEMLDSDEYR